MGKHSAEGTDHDSGRAEGGRYRGKPAETQKSNRDEGAKAAKIASGSFAVDAPNRPSDTGRGFRR